MATRILNTLKLGLGIAAMAAVCLAAGSVASVTSAQPFTVDGVQLSTPGVNSWPLISNDEVATTVGAALMTFRDGSAIKLAPQSRVRLAGSMTSPQVILMAGNLDTKLAPGSKLLVTREDGASGADQDTGAVPDFPVANTGARANNNTTFRKAALLYSITGVTLAGLGIAVDAILQPAAASIR
jgi:hypothetical protein